MPDEQFPSIAAAFPVEQQAEDLTLPEPLGATDSGTDTATCMATCLPTGMNFKWLSHFPQSHYSSAQGFVGQRVAYFQGSQVQLQAALRIICGSHWPPPPGWVTPTWAPSAYAYEWWKDTLPVDVQCGSAGDERTIRVFGNIADAEISNKLESYNEYRIIVTYQLLHISDPWPITGTPIHPQGTSLMLQIRGGGETLMLDPTAIAGGKASLTGCFSGQGPAASFKDNTIARFIIPLTEYHLTCDRITDAQLCDIFSQPWKCREGTVNCDRDPYFMNEDEGTLLFDSWTLDQTFVPDVDDPRRWRLGCVLKCRQVPNIGGPYPDTCECDPAGSCYPLGWNHDYKRDQTGQFGWQFITMNVRNNWKAVAAYTPHGNCPNPFVPRYQYRKFADLFCSIAGECTTVVSPCDGITDCTTDSSPCGPFEASQPARISHSVKQDEYADIQERVAQIVDEARKARARKIMRDNERLARGEIDVWPEDSGLSQPIKQVTVKPGGEIIYPEGS